MMKIIILLLACLCVNVCFTEEIPNLHPDTYLSITELAEKYGYPMESHDVTTEDGYILTIYRIPHGQNGSGAANKKVVLLVHGLYGEAENYVVNGRYNGSLAFLLADNGYDVWLANSRGTHHGRRHVALNPDQYQFWNFSWHEIGIYDLPATIDYILEDTKKPKLYYVGFSQGGTVFYVLNTVRPEYQKKIAMASLISPGGYMVHMETPIVKRLSKNHKLIMEMAEKYKMYEFPNTGNGFSELLSSLCVNTTLHNVCFMVLRNMGVLLSKETDVEMLPLTFRFIPTAAIKQIVHYLQGVDSGRFRYFDHGSKEKNMEAYGYPEPPDYLLENILIPTAFYFGLNDDEVNYKDVADACRKLPNCVKLKRIKRLDWIHHDFVLAMSRKKEINLPVLRFMQKYEENLNF